MRNFFSRYSYGMVRMFINQFAIGLFGAVLSFAAMMGAKDTQSNVLTIIAGVFSVLFYLFLIYTVAWEIGAKDRISIDCGKLKSRPYRGIIISLLANIPSFILAIVHAVALFVPPVNDLVEVISRFIASLFIDGMYFGFLSVIKVGGVEITRLWWTYFVVIIPAVLVSGIAYYIGTKNIHFTKMLEQQYPESDREPKKKWFGRK